jgi:MoxR-like ATPase
VEGPAGVGKTELAKAVARATERTLFRLQCYEGLDEARALYEWNYTKQMLVAHVAREQRATSASDVGLFTDEFLIARPLLAAIQSTEPALLLIDEIDRADAELEALLLEVLGEFQVTIPEIGTVHATSRPFVVLTSNASRDLTDALRRRCLHAFIDFPSPQRELQIIHARLPDADEDLARQVIAIVRAIRDMELLKAPSVAESLEWLKAIIVLGAQSIDATTFRESLGVLIKHQEDAAVVSARADDILMRVKSQTAR